MIFFVAWLLLGAIMASIINYAGVKEAANAVGWNPLRFYVVVGVFVAGLVFLGPVSILAYLYIQSEFEKEAKVTSPKNAPTTDCRVVRGMMYYTLSATTALREVERPEMVYAELLLGCPILAQGEIEENGYVKVVALGWGDNMPKPEMWGYVVAHGLTDKIPPENERDKVAIRVFEKPQRSIQWGV